MLLKRMFILVWLMVFCAIPSRADFAKTVVFIDYFQLQADLEKSTGLLFHKVCTTCTEPDGYMVYAATSTTNPFPMLIVNVNSSSSILNSLIQSIIVNNVKQ